MGISYFGLKSFPMILKFDEA